MFNKTNRIFDYFAVTGLDHQLNSTNTAYQNERKLTDIAIYSVKLQQSCFNQKTSNLGYIENKKVYPDNYGNVWIDLTGSMNLWLKCTYDEIGKSPITYVDFCYFKNIGSNTLKTPKDNNRDLKPTPVIHIDQQQQSNQIIETSAQLYDILKNNDDKYNPNNEKVFKESFNNDTSINNSNIDGHIYFKGDFNLTQLLDAEAYQKYDLVLAYIRQSQYNYFDPICILDISVGHRKTKKIHGDLTYVIPSKFYAVKNLIAFGNPKKNRILIYKTKENVFDTSYQPCCIQRYPTQDHKYYEFNEEISWQCFPQGVRILRENHPPQSFSFIITDEYGSRIYCTCLIFCETVSKTIFDKLGHVKQDKKNPIYEQKAICLTSQYPYLYEQKELLKHIYRFVLSKYNTPLECLIYNIVNDLKLPSNLNEWGTSIKFDLGIGQQPLIFKTNRNYPHFNSESIKILFRVFDIDKVISLVQCLMLEKQIYLISKYKSLITHVSAALVSLIYPFQWINAWVPILPDTMKESQMAPFPFIMGINQNDPNHAQGLQSDAISAYIDSNDLLNIESLPQLPEKYYKQLLLRLKKYEQITNLDNDSLQEFIENSDSAFHTVIFENTSFNVEFDSYVVKDAFFEFICSLMKNYVKYIKPDIKASDGKVQMCNEIMNVKKFLQDHHHGQLKEGSFLQRFVEQTQNFPFFIEQRYFQNAQSPYYTFFDQSIQTKRNKKNPLLISPQKQEKCIECPKPLNWSELYGQKDQLFVYERFPQLQKNYFDQCDYNKQNQQQEVRQKEISVYQQDGGNNLKDMVFFSQEQIQINQLDDYKWTKYLLEEMYALWFMLFSIRIKNHFHQNYFSQLTEYAILLLNELVHKKKIFLNKQFFYKTVIQACGYQGKTAQVSKIYQQMKDEQNHWSPQLYGEYFQAIEHANEFQKQNELDNKQQQQQQSIQQQQDYENGKQHSLYQKKQQQINKTESQQNNNKNIINLNINNKSFNIDEVIFQLADNQSCPSCQRKIINLEEVFAGFQQKNYSNEDFNIKCLNPSCTNQKYIPRFKVMNSIQNKDDFDSQEYNLLSPQFLKKQLENEMTHFSQQDQQNNDYNKDVFQFIFNQQKKDNSTLYWNLAFYFNFLNLPFLFMDVWNQQQKQEQQQQQNNNYENAFFQKKYQSSIEYLNIQEFIKQKEEKNNLEKSGFGGFQKLQSYFNQQQSQLSDKKKNSKIISQSEAGSDSQKNNSNSQSQSQIKLEQSSQHSLAGHNFKKVFGSFNQEYLNQLEIKLSKQVQQLSNNNKQQQQPQQNLLELNKKEQSEIIMQNVDEETTINNLHNNNNSNSKKNIKAYENSDKNLNKNNS